jgi:DNA-binding transcriptional LysR family regulator
MTLTEPGHALAERVPSLLAGWDELRREVQGTASRAARVLRGGSIAGGANEATQQIIAAFTRRRPGWRVETRQASWTNPSAGLADGDVDAALLRLPFPGQDSLRARVLFTEPRWVALPTAHPLATRDEIRFRDLWDEPFVAAPPETGWWRSYWLATEERDGHPVRIGAVTDQPDDWLSAIANGYGIALAPESAARFYARPGVTYRPVTGLSPSKAAVAWAPAADDNPVVQDFVRCCLESRTPPP